MPAEPDDIVIQETGIEGLDEVLQGGIPEGHVVLLTGQAGTGKTVLSMQWLFEGVDQYSQSGIYVAVTEPITKALRNVSSMGFYSEAVVESGDLHFTDLRSMENLIGMEGELEKDDMDELVEAIVDLVEETGAKRMVIDSITAIGYKVDNTELFRYFIFRLGTELSGLGCTVFLTSETESSDSRSTPFNVEDFISDGVIHLDNLGGEQAMIRHLNVLKMRGVDYRSGTVNMDMTSEGVIVYPKIPVDLSVAETDFEDRLGTGVEKLDELTGGGYPEGHAILVGGNTGAGKSTVGMEFLVEGMENGEPAVLVNLEESRDQVMKTAKAHGWDLEGYEDDGLLRFVTLNLIDIHQDKFLYEVLDAVDDIDADRVVIDSVSSLRSAAMDDEAVRQLLLQMNSSFKSRGVTALMTYLSSHMFNATSDKLLGSMQSSELRLSSITDGIILLRYVEHDNQVSKMLHVLKMRGSEHDKGIWELDITEDGVEIGERFS